jgi:hypothetical protein
MKPRKMSDKSPNSQGKNKAPAGWVKVKNWLGRECQLDQGGTRKSEKTTMDQQLVVGVNR